MKTLDEFVKDASSLAEPGGFLQKAISEYPFRFNWGRLVPCELHYLGDALKHFKKVEKSCVLIELGDCY